MTLIYIETIKDHLDREWLVFHAPSSTVKGKVYKVKNLKHTDTWSCHCLAFGTYKNPCRHVPNGVEPPKKELRPTSHSAGALPISSSVSPPPSVAGEDTLFEDTAEKLMTLQQMIENLAARDSYFRRLCIERKSGPFIMYLLQEYHGVVLPIPEGHSLETFLMSLPQFSTIRTAVYEVRRKKRSDPLWQDPDPSEGKNHQDAYAWATVAGRDPGNRPGQSSFEVAV